jgi:hypothetical protein
VSNGILGRRAVGIALVSILAAGVAVSTMLAIHFHVQATDLSVRSAATAGASISPTLRATSALVRPADASAPPLSLHSYDLMAERPQATVYLTVASADGGASTQGQLLISAFVQGGPPNVEYRLTGGDCESATAQTYVWADGAADATGTALLSGHVWTLPKADDYYLVLETGPTSTASRAPEPGMEGVFVLGQAAPFPPGQQPCN